MGEIGRTAGQGSPRRVEALADGVFAIVMTLIVLEIRVPSGPAGELGAQLVDVLPTLLTYAITFAVLGILWFGHRSQFELIERADHPLVWLNLAFLGVIALVPFSSAVLARYPTERLAIVVYGVHLTVAGLLHGGSWAYATLRPGVLGPAVTPRYRRVSRWASFTPAVGYALGTVVGALAPIAGLVVLLLVPLPFVSGLYYRALAGVDR